MDGRQNLVGAGLMMASMAAFTLNDACMKLLSGKLPLAEAVFLRGALVCVSLFVVGRWMGVLRFRMRRRDAGLIALRTLAELGSTYFFLTALFHMPLPNVTAILQVLPLTVALSAALVFREPLGWRRLVAIAAGFAGVLLIIQPGGADFTVYSLYAVAAVGCVTVRDLSARRLSREVSSVAVALIAAFAITLAAGGVMLVTGGGFPQLDEIEVRTIQLVFGAALFVLVGYLASVVVMRVGEISFIAPFRYTGLIWALVLGWYVFGYWPDPLELTGAAIVVSMGIFTLYREGVIRRRAARAPR